MTTYFVNYKEGRNGHTSIETKLFSDPADSAMFYMGLLSQHRDEPGYTAFIGARDISPPPDAAMVEWAKQWCAGLNAGARG